MKRFYSQLSMIVVLAMGVVTYSAEPAHGLSCKSLFKSQPLSFDERFKAAEAEGREARDRAVTVLLAEAYYPTLKSLSEKALSLEPEAIVGYSRLYSPDLILYPLPFPKGEGAIYRGEKAELRRFESRWQMTMAIRDGGPYAQRPGHTRENEKLMQAAVLASFVLEHQILSKMEPTEGPTGSLVLRSSTTFEPNVTATVATGIRTILQSFGQLSVEKVSGLSDLELARSLFMAPESGPRFSLIEQHALRLPPGYLATTSPALYFEKPVEFVSGELRFTQPFAQLIKELSRDFAEQKKKTKPFWPEAGTGKGCPVAHCAGTEISGLGELNKAYYFILETIYKSL